MGNSNHSWVTRITRMTGVTLITSMAQVVPKFCVSRRVFLNHLVNWNTVRGAIQNPPWHNIWSADNPAEVFNEHLSLLIGYVPTKVINVHNKDRPCCDDQECMYSMLLTSIYKLIFCEPEITLRLSGESFVHCQVRASIIFIKRDVLMNIQSLHKWLATFKTAVFGSSSSLLFLVGGLVSETVGTAYLLSDHIDSKQSRESVDMSFTCHPSHFTSAFRLSKVRRLLLDLNPYAGTDPLGMFSLFLKITADVLAIRLSALFQLLFRLCSLALLEAD